MEPGQINSGYSPVRAVSLVVAAAAAITIARMWVDSNAQPAVTIKGREPYTQRPVTPRGPLTPEETNAAAIFQNTAPSVVFITSATVEQDIFTMSLHEIPRGSGSGFVWDAEGRILTNFHVIVDASRIEVTMSDGSKHKASLVGAAPDKDVAVLKINAPAGKLKPIPIGDSAGVRVGQTVYAIGSPFGLDKTMTSGIVSALNREIEALNGRIIQGVIQTDAAINPGNSGGPLLDSAGRLIGINTQIVSPSGASSGVGFSVPVETVNQVASQIIKYGKVIRPGLGVEPASDSLALRLGLVGVMIRRVEPGGSADKAGLKGIQVSGRRITLGDVITAIDGVPIRSFNDLGRIMDERHVGDKVTVEIMRGGAPRKMTVTLMELD